MRETEPHQLWGGRFAAGPARALDALNRSLPIDIRLWPHDIRGSQAWAGALHRAGVLDGDEAQALGDGLARVAERLQAGEGTDAPDEDVHTLVERLLYEEVGGVAGKLHTGRSRNDQVSTDLRLWTLAAIDQLQEALRDVIRALVDRAAEGVDVLLPGYTHGQRAQPVRWAYVLLAHAWPLVRDLDRLSSARRSTDGCPLGSGALAGSGVAVDRRALAAALDFGDITANALDATGDRDFVIDTLYALTMVATHLSRLAGEVIVYASSEFGFVRLADEFSTGSSLLPQKRNPDGFELARAKAGRAIGNLTAMLTVIKGVPAGYQKDLQEDKAVLFDTADAIALTLPAMSGAIRTLQVNADAMRAALDDTLRATDLADLLTREGVPFREAHELVGQLVREADRTGVDLTAVPDTTSAAIHHLLPNLIASLGDWEDSVERRATDGGSSRASVQQQIEVLQELVRP